MLQLFKEYDKQKLTAMSVEDLDKLLEDLWNDKCNMGKVCLPLKAGWIPFLEKLEKRAKDGKIHWKTLRENLNKLEWRLIDKFTMNEKIDTFYKDAGYLKMKGDIAGAKEQSLKALRLIGTQTKTKPIEIVPKPKEPELKRGDFFVLPVF